MKIVWITCAVLCVCGCLCSIGIFFMGRTMLDAAKKADAEADLYASDTVNVVCKNWSADELFKRMSHDAVPGLEKRVAKDGKPLGALKSATPFSVVANGWFYDDGVKTSKVKTDADITCEHGTAHLELTVRNRGTGWQVMDFQINPAPYDSGKPSK
jgi:hypothetical protein